ncbi:LysR family transcriptional regulator [Streptomyces hoynatensis]|uniref:LysR family transcriptional regulator n=1 Tax=Streptomyces hoynatensis TaxID=1141874 RepID=UPI00240D6470|nr:LysR family transcriptional regulator [Streptomyces hoynatensis]
MDPHLLRTFVSVARLGSFSAAAAELGYTQSAVSQHVAALEQDLGARLLTRRPVAPTPAGARLLEHAGPLLVRLAAARADVARLVSAPAGRLAVGLAPLTAQAAAPGAALAAACRAHPGVEVTVEVRPAARLPAAVATGELDLALVEGFAAPTDPLRLPDVGPLRSVQVGEEPLAVLLPEGHPLAGRPRLRLADLAGARWLDAPDAGVALDRLRAAAGTGGFRTGLRYAGSDPGGLLPLAAAGLGLALLPRSRAAAGASLGLRAVPLSEPRLVHRTELLHPARLTPPGGTLRDHLLRARGAPSPPAPSPAP